MELEMQGVCAPRARGETVDSCTGSRRSHIRMAQTTDSILWDDKTVFGKIDGVGQLKICRGEFAPPFTLLFNLPLNSKNCSVVTLPTCLVK